MKQEHREWRFSATDLASFLACDHRSQLERQSAMGLTKKPFRDDKMLDLLIELGHRHEQSYLNHLQSQGLVIVEVPAFGGQHSETATITAMRNGVDVVTQGAIRHGQWHGMADFLLKVDTPSDLGNWSYEVADTKLAKSTKGTAVIQLSLYSDIVASIQGLHPKFMHVVAPGDPFAVDSLLTGDFQAFFRALRTRFEASMRSDPNPATYPEPCAHCQICDWWTRCDSQWRSDDHLTYVAGINKSQRHELIDQDISTLTEFAEATTPLPSYPTRGSMESFKKAHLQAKIQLKGRRTGKPEYEFNRVEKDRGFLKLPAPSPGDVFFDIEGNPRAMNQGLEYLFGYVTIVDNQTKFTKHWALNDNEEKRMLEQFVHGMLRRWAQYPDMHIYHYAPYEPSALKRLVCKHATCEDELDKLLRGGRLVDLYAIARQGIRASVESYSIKRLEPFYGYEREQDMKESSPMLRRIERAIELGMMDEIGEPEKDIVALYNKDDCVSTWALRNWLEKLRAELIEMGAEVPRPELIAGDPSETVQEQSTETRQVFEDLVRDIIDEPVGDQQTAAWLLAHLLEYFRREDKCRWWEFFSMHELDHDGILRERKAIGGLTFIEEFSPTGRGKNPTHRYQFPTQEITVDEGDSLIEVGGKGIGTVHSVDLDLNTIDIKKSGRATDIHPESVFAFDNISTVPMPESLLEFGRSVAADHQSHREIKSARYDLLARNRPRLHTQQLPVSGDMVETATRLALDLDDSILPIQGPPGTGKTYVGSHMITTLARAGKKVGVTAVSHKVIQNLLTKVHTVSSESGVPVSVAHRTKSGPQPEDTPNEIGVAASREDALCALHGGSVVGGTSWLWSHPECEGVLDYLFIDEAGQMSLAMALAAGRAAKNIILLGDPQQLEQPQQGTHPMGSGVAALCHLLSDDDTMPEDRGLFLAKTWRLHPSICSFTSEMFYDHRLTCVESLSNQEITGDSELVGSGLRFVPVHHVGNQNRSNEEVDAVCRLVMKLTDGHHQWIDKDSVAATITLDDIRVVAPFNAQVSALKARLPAGTHVGTVDKFQGQEAPVVIYSMTCSSANDSPRGMGFLYNANRLNVATSRARCLVLLVCSPKLFVPDCKNPDQMRLANGFCRYFELASKVSVPITGESTAP